MIKGCEVCENEEAKYKCTKCYIPFCSVACGQSHKNNCVGSTQISDVKPLISDDGDSKEWLTENTVPLEKLEKLKESSKLREMLKNKDLQAILKVVDKADAESVEQIYTEAIKVPIFDEFVQECLSVVLPNDERWN